MESDIAYSAIRISTPLIYAAMGGLLTYQAGILNIALDGFMIVAAFAAIAVTYATTSLTLGVIGGVVSAIVLAGLLAIFNLKLRANIFIAGIAVTFLAYGLTALLLKGLLGQEGVFSSDRIPTFAPLRIPIIADIPIIGPPLSGHTMLVYFAYLLVPIVAFFLYRTRWGLRVRVVGEAEDAAAAAGISIFAIKFETMLLSGLFCGLAGAYLSLGYVSLFAKQMTNERGLIALAAIFFANGNPYWTAAVALLFGAATALSVRLPQATGAAPQLLQLIPYVVTLLALVAVGVRKTRARNRHGAWRFEV
jgi:simple sugar transport system permease protein